MKTTIELPDALFQSVKATAARRRMSLKELFTHALKREIGDNESPANAIFDVDELGLPVLKQQNETVTNDRVRRLQEDE